MDKQQGPTMPHRALRPMFCETETILKKMYIKCIYVC